MTKKSSFPKHQINLSFYSSPHTDPLNSTDQPDFTRTLRVKFQPIPQLEAHIQTFFELKKYSSTLFILYRSPNPSLELYGVVFNHKLYRKNFLTSPPKEAPKKSSSTAPVTFTVVIAGKETAFTANSPKLARKKARKFLRSQGYSITEAEVHFIDTENYRILVST